MKRLVRFMAILVTLIFTTTFVMVSGATAAPVNPNFAGQPVVKEVVKPASNSDAAFVAPGVNPFFRPAFNPFFFRPAFNPFFDIDVDPFGPFEED
jgi:hypothetical protein